MNSFSKEIVEIAKDPFRIFSIDNFFDYNFYLDIKKLFDKLDPKELSLTKNFGKTFIHSNQASFDDDNENQIFSKLNKIIFSDEFFYFFVKNSYIKNIMFQSNILRKIRYLRYPVSGNNKVSLFDFLFSKISVSYNFSYIKNNGGILPHVDAQRKYLSLLLYFPDDIEKEIEYGTTFWSSKSPNYTNTHIQDAAQINKFKNNSKVLFKSPFIANCLYGFNRNNFSWHSAEPTAVNPNYVRKSLNINLLYDN
jgi:hypothetical protein